MKINLTTKYELGDVVITNLPEDKKPDHQGILKQIIFYENIKTKKVEMRYVLDSMAYVDDKGEPMGVPNMGLLIPVAESDILKKKKDD